MASSILVADYGSSDSENEEETSREETEQGKKTTSQLPARVNLLASTEDNSDSDTDNDVCKGKSKLKNSDDNRETEKLPLPSVLGMDSSNQHGVAGTASLASSIFANPFEEAEKHKLSILEQHVKLTSAQRKEMELGGKKKICWKFRNGKCRFGHKCKFAHDSDVPSTLNSAGIEAQQGDGSAASDGTSFQEYIGSGFDQGAWTEEGVGEDDNEEEGLLKRKRRPGLSQTLVPSKKVMTSYSKQRNQERPWLQNR